jgi:hypothetical protein
MFGALLVMKITLQWHKILGLINESIYLQSLGQDHIYLMGKIKNGNKSISNNMLQIQWETHCCVIPH